MKLFNKIKDLFQGEENISSPSNQGETNSVSSTENYLENKNEAINIICGRLARYSYSTDKNLAVLNLWVVMPQTDSQVSWADANFLKELKTRLSQERIEAVKRIELKSVSLPELNNIISQDPLIKPMVQNRLYYKTHALSEQSDMTLRKASIAWLICIGGDENVRERIVQLDPESQTLWNIGRCERPSVIDTNDIVINDDCKDISRQQCAIVIDDGKYYLKCKEGGCRARGGRVTKIIRSNRLQEELVSLSHRALSHLKEGDVIQLSKSVYYRFTYKEPEIQNKPSALQQVDDSF